MSTILTDNLDALYAEVEPKFTELRNKKSEIETEIEETIQLKQTAEENYDLVELERLSNTEENLNIILSRVRRDLDEHMQKVNSPGGVDGEGSLVSVVTDAYAKDFEIENAKAQELFTNITSLEDQLEAAKKELVKRNRTVIERLAPARDKFNSFKRSDISSVLSLRFELKQKN